MPVALFGQWNRAIAAGLDTPQEILLYSNRGQPLARLVHHGAGLVVERLRELEQSLASLSLSLATLTNMNPAKSSGYRDAVS